MLLASIFMAGGTGILNSVCQSTALLLAPKNKRGLANSTFYIGIDLGMALGPIIAGFFYEHFPLDLFYPLFFITIPLAIIGYFFYRQKAKLYFKLNFISWVRKNSSYPLFPISIKLFSYPARHRIQCKLPFAPITRWHGTIIDIGLCPTAPPTALCRYSRHFSFFCYFLSNLTI